jgi:ATP-dependent Lon protease
MIKQNGVASSRACGAIPKDGPQRRRDDGDGACLALYGRKVRHDTSMTGEITLSGLVFPVGGIKEKVLAAHRAGIRRIIFRRKMRTMLKKFPKTSDANSR